MQVLARLRKTASRSKCRFRIAAVAFNKRGDLLGFACNQPRFIRKGGGIHAEEALMRDLCGIKTIIICRVGASGNLLPIVPCDKCKKLAKKKGIRIYSILEML